MKSHTFLTPEWIYSALKLYEKGVISFSNINDLLALLSNRKKLFRFGTFHSSNIKKLIPVINNLNLQYIVKSHHINYNEVVESGDKFLNDKGNKSGIIYMLFASIHKKDLQIADAIESDNDVDSINYYYGYPKCCIKSYFNRNNNYWWETYLGIFCNHYTNKIAELFNKPTFMNEYFPCSGNCKETIKMAIQNKSVLQELVGPVFIDSIDKSLFRVYSINPKIKDVGKFRWMNKPNSKNEHNIFNTTTDKFNFDLFSNNYIIFT